MTKIKVKPQLGGTNGSSNQTLADLQAKRATLLAEVDEQYRYKEIALKQWRVLNRLVTVIENRQVAETEGALDAIGASMFGVPIFAVAFVETAQAEEDQAKMVAMYKRMRTQFADRYSHHDSVYKTKLAQLAEVEADISEILTAGFQANLDSNGAQNQSPIMNLIKKNIRTGIRKRKEQALRERISNEFADKYSDEAMAERQSEREAEVEMKRIKAEKLKNFAIIGAVAVVAVIAVLRR
jgi:hypothetical protein